MPPFSLDAAVAALDEKQRCAALSRIEIIRLKQRQRGMLPRSDSRLTYEYATNHSLFADDVVSELIMVDYIHQRTLYGMWKETVFSSMARYIKEAFGLTWTDAWQLTRFYAPPMLQLFCLQFSESFDRLQYNSATAH